QPDHAGRRGSARVRQRPPVAALWRTRGGLAMAAHRLDIGFLLDRQCHALRGEMEQTKRPALLALARVLADAGTPYESIGGVALQVHLAEPRTTQDIDLVVSDLDELPV